jgi:hypothetical protein
VEEAGEPFETSASPSIGCGYYVDCDHVSHQQQGMLELLLKTFLAIALPLPPADQTRKKNQKKLDLWPMCWRSFGE